MTMNMTMNMKLVRMLLCVSAAVAGLCLAGCNRDRTHRQSSNEESSEEQSQPEYIIVREAPPEAIVEQRPPAPSDEYVWVDGYWVWNQDQYVWNAGRWERPPQRDYIWAAPRYDRHDQGFRITLGQWQEQPRERRRDDDRRDRR